jgi:hypothetical protein
MLPGGGTPCPAVFGEPGAKDQVPRPRVPLFARVTWLKEHTEMNLRKKMTCIGTVILIIGLASLALAFPTVYPTGTTIYHPEKCWSGFTIFPTADRQGAVLIDMNGNVIKHWKNILGEPIPNKILPGGYVVGATGASATHQEFFDLVQVDMNDNVVWRFDRGEQVEDKVKGKIWSARQHHDWQREGNPVGYYAPGMDPKSTNGNTLILSHKNVKNPKISDKLLEDDWFYEVTWDGKIVWEWLLSDHFDELGLDEEAKKTMYKYPGWNDIRGAGDWAHVNNMNYLGPNKWYDQGDQRFHPDNIIWDARELNIIGITDKKTGKIVWKVGPDYSATPALQKLGQIIGLHHAHMIPKGLPGAGNILVFDNGGSAGYGPGNPGAPTGFKNAIRDYSRVIEFNPLTLEVVWEYNPRTAGFGPRNGDFRFYSHYISAAQRLPNGNTMITEGADGRMFEVTPKYEIVWEYVSPFFGKGAQSWNNMTYRGYRVPYEWVPQVKKPVEKAVIPPRNSEFRVDQAGMKAAPPAAPAGPATRGKKEEEEAELPRY